MSPSAKSVLRYAVLILGAGGVLGVGWVGLAQILRADAFAKFHGDGSPVGSEVGVELTDFHMKAYERGRLTTDVIVDKVAVRRDRSQMMMSGLHDGTIYDEDGESYSFEAQDAVYHYFTKRLDATNGARISNDDMDLTSDKFSYDQASGNLLVSGKVTGVLNGGEIEAADVSLNTKTDAIKATDVHWTGELDDLGQDGQRKKWDIQGAFFESDGEVSVYTDGRATDGEIIVVADRIEYTKETDVLVAKGNVKYWGLDANVLCDQATVFRKERRAVMVGHVTMFIKSEDDETVEETEIPRLERATPESLKTNPQGATDEQIEVLRDAENMRTFPVKVVSDKVEYWYREGERRAIITGNPFARQDLKDGWRLSWSYEAFYDGEAETLTLKSREGERDARLILSIGDDYQAFDVTLSTKEDVKKYSGHGMRASLFLDDDESSTGGSTGGGTGG